MYCKGVNNMSEEKPFKLNKKEICITSTQIKQAIDLLVNENEILQDRIYELEEVLDKIKEYITTIDTDYAIGCWNKDEEFVDVKKDILELLEEIE